MPKQLKVNMNFSSKYCIERCPWRDHNDVTTGYGICKFAGEKPYLIKQTGEACDYYYDGSRLDIPLGE